MRRDQGEIRQVKPWVTTAGALSAALMLANSLAAQSITAGDTFSMLPVSGAENMKLAEHSKAKQGSKLLDRSERVGAINGPGGPGGSIDIEPNDTPAQATPLGSGAAAGVRLKASLSPAGDVDFYSFTAAAGDRVYAATTTAFSPAQSDTVLSIIGADGSTVLETDDDDGSLSPYSSSIAGVSIPANGTYFVRVMAFSRDDQVFPYELYLRVAHGPGDTELEPNNLPTSANPLPASGCVSGAISPAASDVDVFSVSLGAGDTIFLSLDLDPQRDLANGDGQLAFGLFDGPNYLAVNDNGHSGPNSEALAMTVKDAGLYFVAVAGGSQNDGPDFNYALCASIIHPSPPIGTVVAASSVDVPKAIGPDSGPITSTLTIPGSHRISKLRVHLNLDHANMANLDVHLISPAGNDNALFSHVGSDQFQYMDLTLDDDAALPIGSFPIMSVMECQPQSAYRLDWFKGEEGGGTWTLVIDSGPSGDAGTLIGWGLQLVDQPLPSCPPGNDTIVVYSADFESGAAGFRHSGVHDAWQLGTPSAGAIQGAFSGVNCWKTGLNSTYDSNSNQDLFSPTIDLTAVAPPIFVQWAQKFQLESAEFDHAFVEVRRADGTGARVLWMWTGPDMQTQLQSGALHESAGWAIMQSDISDFAGQSIEFRFHLDSDSTVERAGLAIDDLKVNSFAPTGACCFPNGSCQDLMQAACDAAAGTYQGDGTSCTQPNICPLPGVCCFPNGSCLPAPSTLGCVAGSGGVYQGNNTLCDAVACSQPGGCCLPNGMCVTATALGGASCMAAGGVYAGDNTPCAVVACRQPGACCYPNGSCQAASVIGGGGCPGAGGVYAGDNTHCAVVACPQPGGCCLPNGMCVTATAIGGASCTAAGGVYAGDNTPCAVAACPHPGACCLANGSCAPAAAVGGAACTAAGGSYQGDNSLCAAVACPQPGACCLPNGNCNPMLGPTCLASGGVFQGAGSICTAGLCPQPGACCLPDGSCVQAAVVGGASCIAAGGTYSGNNSVCTGVACIQPGRFSDTEKGSVLVFSKVDIRWNAAGALIQDTFIDISNDYPADVRLHMYFVNGDPPLAAVPTGQPGGPERAHPGWNRIDNSLNLTANQPLYWSARTGAPAGLSPYTVLDPGTPPGRPDPEGTTDRVLRGFVYAIAVNSNGAEIKWNHLSGNGTVINYRDGSAWEYNSWAAAAVNPALAHGAATGTPGIINLDGFEFARGFDFLLFNFQAAGATAFSRVGANIIANPDLTLHPVSVDFRQQTSGPVFTKASFDVWNQNEVKFSGAERCIRCWDERLLANYGNPNHFLRANLQSDFGKARVDGVASTVCNSTSPPVTSQNASLLGLLFTQLNFNNGAAFATAGGNVHGLGWQNGVIKFDATGGEPPSNVPEAP